MGRPSVQGIRAGEDTSRWRNPDARFRMDELFFGGAVRLNFFGRSMTISSSSSSMMRRRRDIRRRRLLIRAAPAEPADRRAAYTNKHSANIVMTRSVAPLLIVIGPR